MTSKCSKLRQNHRPQSTDHWKLLSIFFVNNIDGFWRPFPLKFLGKSRPQEREKQIAPPTRHFYDLYSYRTTRLHGMADVTPSALGLGCIYDSLLFGQTGHNFEFSSSKLRRKHSPTLATEKRMLKLKQGLVNCQSISDGYFALPASINKKGKVLPLTMCRPAPSLAGLPGQEPILRSSNN